MKPGGLFIDHTTVSARIARQLFVEGESRGLHCVDAPVTGGQAGAEKASLAVMCGGSEPAVAAARIVMQAYAPRIVPGGRAGAGQTAKMVHPICHAGRLQRLAEALLFLQGSAAERAMPLDQSSHRTGDVA